jgi:hypothetical protein
VVLVESAAGELVVLGPGELVVFAAGELEVLGAGELVVLAAGELEVLGAGEALVFGEAEAVGLGVGDVDFFVAPFAVKGTQQATAAAHAMKRWSLFFISRVVWSSRCSESAGRGQ